MPKSKAISAEAAAGQRMKELRLRYSWKQAQIFSDHSQVTAIESGQSEPSAELVRAYVNAFRVDQRTLNDYRSGLITCDEFIVRAGVQPGDGGPEGIQSERASTMAPPRLAAWEHDEVEELLVLTLVARGMPRLVAGVVVRAERLKLRDYPTWALRIAHMESVREADDEDARLVPPKKNVPAKGNAPAKVGNKPSVRAPAERAAKGVKAKPATGRGAKSAAPAKRS